MVIAATASNAGNGNQTSATTLVITVGGGNVAVGDLIVVYIAADNAGTSGASSISSVTDSGGNSYSQIKLQNRTAGSVAADGCTCAIYASVATTGLTSGSSTITVNFSPATTAKAARYQAFSGVGALSTSVPAVSSSGSGATYDATALNPTLSGMLVVACAANESATAPAADSDTVGGAWNGTTQSSAGSGGDATKMAVRSAYKIVAAEAAQQFNGATGASTDWAAVAAAYHEPAIPLFAFTSKGRVAWVNS